jgi:tetratricopeptide (TPR) repeat protein
MTSRRLHRLLLTGLLLLPLVASVAADDLRNIKVGGEVPAFELRTLGGETVRSEDLRGKVVVLVFVAAQQRSSERATVGAHDIFQDLHHDDLVLLYVSADTAQAAYFRQFRDRTNVHETFTLDFDRSLYGDLGLIVLPTTILIDREGRLAHIISSYKSDYEHVLKSHAMHTLGVVNDQELEKLLKTRTYERNRPGDRIARHRAAARLLLESGMTRDAENELRAAMGIDPQHADTRLDLAALYVDQQRVRDAEALVLAVLEEDKYHRRGRLLHGVVTYHAGRLDKAEEILTQALVLNPDPIQTHYYLGLIYEKKGDQEKALEHFKEALTRLMAKRPL